MAALRTELESMMDKLLLERDLINKTADGLLVTADQRIQEIDERIDDSRALLTHKVGYFRQNQLVTIDETVARVEAAMELTDETAVRNELRALRATSVAHARLQTNLGLVLASPIFAIQPVAFDVFLDHPAAAAPDVSLIKVNLLHEVLARGVQLRTGKLAAIPTDLAETGRIFRVSDTKVQFVAYRADGQFWVALDLETNTFAERPLVQDQAMTDVLLRPDGLAWATDGYRLYEIRDDGSVVRSAEIEPETVAGPKAELPDGSEVGLEDRIPNEVILESLAALPPGTDAVVLVDTGGRVRVHTTETGDHFGQMMCSLLTEDQPIVVSCSSAHELAILYDRKLVLKELDPKTLGWARERVVLSGRDIERFERLVWLNATTVLLWYSRDGKLFTEILEVGVLLDEELSGAHGSLFELAGDQAVILPLNREDLLLWDPSNKTYCCI